jgi:hypothetical protein
LKDRYALLTAALSRAFNADSPLHAVPLLESVAIASPLLEKGWLCHFNRDAGVPRFERVVITAPFNTALKGATLPFQPAYIQPLTCSETTLP